MKNSRDVYTHFQTVLNRVQSDFERANKAYIVESMLTDRLRVELETAQAEIKVLSQALDLAMRYLGKAVADGLMEDCVVPASEALRRLETYEPVQKVLRQKG